MGAGRLGVVRRRNGEKRRAKWRRDDDGVGSERRMLPTVASTEGSDAQTGGRAEREA
jgi:hypothetical protein